MERRNWSCVFPLTVTPLRESHFLSIASVVCTWRYRVSARIWTLSRAPTVTSDPPAPAELYIAIPSPGSLTTGAHSAGSEPVGLAAAQRERESPAEHTRQNKGADLEVSRLSKDLRSDSASFHSTLDTPADQGLIMCD